MLPKPAAEADRACPTEFSLGSRRDFLNSFFAVRLLPAIKLQCSESGEQFGHFLGFAVRFIRHYPRFVQQTTTDRVKRYQIEDARRRCQPNQTVSETFLGTFRGSYDPIYPHRLLGILAVWLHLDFS